MKSRGFELKSMTVNRVLCDSKLAHKCEQRDKIGINTIWLSFRLSFVNVLHFIELHTMMLASSSLRQQLFNAKWDKRWKSLKQVLMREAAFDVILAKDKSKYSRRGNVESMGTRLHIPKFPKVLLERSNLDRKYTASCTLLLESASAKLGRIKITQCTFHKFFWFTCLEDEDHTIPTVGIFCKFPVISAAEKNFSKSICCLRDQERKSKMLFGLGHQIVIQTSGLSSHSCEIWETIA